MNNLHCEECSPTITAQGTIVHVRKTSFNMPKTSETFTQQHVTISRRRTISLRFDLKLQLKSAGTACVKHSKQ